MPGVEPPALPREERRIWHCDTRFVHCGADAEHPLKYHRADYAAHLRVDGHIWHACQSCRPSTFFFGVARARGDDPLIFFYAITRAQYEFWIHNEAELETSTLEILRRLGYRTGRAE